MNRRPTATRPSFHTHRTLPPGALNGALPFRSTSLQPWTATMLFHEPQATRRPGAALRLLWQRVRVFGGRAGAPRGARRRPEAASLPSLPQAAGPRLTAPSEKVYEWTGTPPPIMVMTNWRKPAVSFRCGNG